MVGFGFWDLEFFQHQVSSIEYPASSIEHPETRNN